MIRILIATFVLIVGVNSASAQLYDPLNIAPRVQRLFQGEQQRNYYDGDYRYRQPPRMGGPSKPVRVDYALPGNTIYVSTEQRKLYLGLGDGTAIRYSIGVGDDGFTWTGTMKIGRKAEWPTWTPTASQVSRRPDYAPYAHGMPGGPRNPLGARALYLHGSYVDKDGVEQNLKGGDSLFRIHGTNNPKSIGGAASSGCFRMMNEDVEDLYDRVVEGATVIVR